MWKYIYTFKVYINIHICIHQAFVLMHEHLECSYNRQYLRSPHLICQAISQYFTTVDYLDYLLKCCKLLSVCHSVNMLACLQCVYLGTCMHFHYMFFYVKTQLTLCLCAELGESNTMLVFTVSSGFNKCCVVQLHIANI